MASKYVSDDETMVLRRYKIAIFEIFDTRFSRLNSSLKNTIESFVNKAFEAGLITEQVKDEKNFNSVIVEFKTGLEWCKSVTEIQKQCVSFVEILEDLGGPARMAGKKLCQELQKVLGMYIYMCYMDHYFYIYFTFNMYAIYIHRKSKNFEFIQVM